VDKVGRDGVRSQANRRVELLSLDAGEEPDLVLAESDPDVSDLYLPGNYQRKPVPTRANGRGCGRRNRAGGSDLRRCIACPDFAVW